MPRLKYGRFGRPVMTIPKDELEFLVRVGFTRPELADLYAVSTKTIGNRLR